MSDQQLQVAYDSWKAAHVEACSNGSAIVAKDAGTVVSEGIGYGMLLAVGMGPGRVVRLILAEAALTTGLGGVCGVVLGFAGLLLFRRSLGFLFESYRVPFRLPPVPELAVAGVVGALLCAGAGLIGAILPAWRAARREPYTLVRGEGG